MRKMVVVDKGCIPDLDHESQLGNILIHISSKVIFYIRPHCLWNSSV